MRLPVLDFAGKVRWANIPDDCAGELERAVSMHHIVRHRAVIVSCVAEAMYGAKAGRHLKADNGLSASDMQTLVEKGWGTPKQLQMLEAAFQNAIQRVRVAAND